MGVGEGFSCCSGERNGIGGESNLGWRVAARLAKFIVANASTAVADAQRRGVPLTDDPCVDLRYVESSRVRDARGKSIPKLTLTPAAATYFDFLGRADALDNPIPRTAEEPDPPHGPGEMLRERSAITAGSPEDVDQLPVIAKVGSGSVVVTAGGYLAPGVWGKILIAGSGGVRPGAGRRSTWWPRECCRGTWGRITGLTRRSFPGAGYTR